MRRFLGLVGLVAAVSLLAVVAGSAAAGGKGGIPVVPVYGKAVGHGLRLYVFVYYARGGKPGPPSGHGHGHGGGTNTCSDTNTQTGFTAPFAFAGPLTFHVTESTVPSGLGADAALGTAAGSWDGSGATLSVKSDGTATAPVQDGVSTIGWAHLVPKNVLAATWAYENSSNHVVEADIFFNNAQPWATLYPDCPSTLTGNFDVADIATHEMGHALGLNHYSDSGAQATMYPSAPSDEIRKVTLTQGDIDALQVSLNGP